jgi:hypothetical protein
MATSRSVQFYGIETALEAYDNQKIPAWGLFQAGQFLAKYDGTDLDEGATLLETFLRKIEIGYGGNDQTTYTLCVYENPGGKITSKTPYDGSFNFRLVQRLEAHQGNLQNQDERIGRIIEEKLAAAGIGAADEEDEEPAGPWNAIGKLLDHPEIKQALASRVIGFVDRFLGGGSAPLPVQQQPAPAAAMGAVTLSAEEIERVNQAVAILVERDPEIGSHLMAIANVAQADPAKYRSLISMLSLL